MNQTLRIALIATSLALLAGCGNKGPLVLPTPPAPIDPATVPDTPADAAPEETPATEPAVEGTETPPAETPTETPTETPADDDGNG
ncbi:MAG TPA: lipoprotein [Lysobacter sp.]